MQKLNSWIPVPKNSDFSIYNLPFGIFSTRERNFHPGIAIGEHILDLKAALQTDLFSGLPIHAKVFETKFLNDFIALEKTTTKQVRTCIQKALSDENSSLKSQENLFVKQSEATMQMPVKVGDYTDFYSSIEHATNVGRMFRDPENALLPNWRHIPVGYHGRASSIVLSGTSIHRPKGQILPKGTTQPIFQPTNSLDFELEMAFIVGKDTPLGKSITTTKAEDYIFGLVLFNDWSARDIQKWEYVPLGPFLGKSFASSIAPWIVTLEALEDFRVKGPEQKPEVLPYLQYKALKNYDINLEVAITPQEGEETTVACSNFKYMYWNMAQQLAHHTVNGCNIRVGDMMASGTISGKDSGSYGSMLELAWAGTKPITLKNGNQRIFIKDHDKVIMRGFAQNQNKRIGFGKVSTKILPAL